MQIDTEQLQGVAEQRRKGDPANLEVSGIPHASEITDTYIAELLNALVTLFNTFIAQEEEKRAALELELNTLKQSLDGYVSPDYGMLPVPAVIYERVIEFAQTRSVSPGVVMTSPRVLEHLRQMIEREIL